MHLKDIIKRDGKHQTLKLDEIEARITQLCERHGFFSSYPNSQSRYINEIFATVVNKLVDFHERQIHTSTIDAITVDVASQMGVFYADAMRLASALYLDNLSKNLIANGGNSFRAYLERLHANVHPAFGTPAPILNEDFYQFCTKNIAALEAIDKRHSTFDIPLEGAQVFINVYAQRINDEVVEWPHDLFMRIAVHLGRDLEDMTHISLFYDNLATGKIVAATPIMTRSGTMRSSLTSCNMIAVSDNMEGIMNVARITAYLSRGGAGIGIYAGALRSNGAYINSTNGQSSGPLPFLRIFEAVANAVNQGGHRRGSFATILPIWHPQVIDMCQMRNEFSGRKEVVSTLFTCIYKNDYYTRCVRENKTWYFFCPQVSESLTRAHGPEFERIYLDLVERYGDNSHVCKSMSARELEQIIHSIKTLCGLPYILDSDVMYATHNQTPQVQENGFIILSNLCTETILAVDPAQSEVASCNLSSIAVNRFITKIENGRDLVPMSRIDGADLILPLIHTPPLLLEYHPEILSRRPILMGRNHIGYDLLHLGITAYTTCIMLNRVIDRTEYACPEAQIPSQRDRPIGIGQQGLGDTILLLGYEFESDEAATINVAIQSTIYYFAWLASADLARKNGAPHPTFHLTNMGRGIMHHDARRAYAESWPENSHRHREFIIKSCDDSNFEFDIASLRAYIATWGTMNNHVTSIQPTESSAKFWGNSEMCEPRKAPVYTQKNSKNGATMVNRYLIQEAEREGYDVEAIYDYVLKHRGSIQGCPAVPPEFAAKYKTIFEIDMTWMIRMCALRAPFVDMAESFNLYSAKNDINLSIKYDYEAYCYALLTRSYYWRTEGASNQLNVANCENSCLMCQ